MSIVVQKKGTVVNRTSLSIYGRLLKIMLTVPLRYALIFSYLQDRTVRPMKYICTKDPVDLDHHTIGAPSHICSSPHGAVSEHPRHGPGTFCSQFSGVNIFIKKSLSFLLKSVPSFSELAVYGGENSFKSNMYQKGLPVH